MAHEHGPHTCYCPNCGESVTVGVNVRCNTQECPICGSQMRAVETGDNREKRLSGGIATMVSTDNIACPTCNFPIAAPSYVGEQVKCAYCGTISQAIQTITIPNSVVVGLICFTAGAVLGPSLWSALKGGTIALERMTRERIK